MSWQKRPALHDKTFYSSHELSCSLGYPSSQLVAFIPHFINLGGTEIPKKGSQLHSFTRDKQQYVDSFEKRKYILCVKYHGVRLSCWPSDRSEDCWATRHRAQHGRMQLFRNTSVFLFKTFKDFKISLANKSQNVRTATPRLKSVDLD